MSLLSSKNSALKLCTGGGRTAYISHSCDLLAGLDQQNDAAARSSLPADSASTVSTASTASTDTTIDLGFRVLKVDTSNRHPAYEVAAFQQSMLAQLEFAFKDDRTALDLFFGCLLDFRLPLDQSVREISLGGHQAFVYGRGELVACFAEDIDASLVHALAALPERPLRVVLLERSFVSSEAQINLTELFKTLLPEVELRVL